MSCKATGKGDPALKIEMPTAVKSSSPISTLPSSLLGEIGRFNSYGTTKSLSLTSKKIHQCQSENTSFHFSDSSIDDEELIDILKNHKGPIFSIDLSNCENITGKSLAYIAERCPRLESLNLSESYLNDADLAPLSKLKHLKTVRLNRNNWLTGAGLKHLQDLQLVTLELKNCLGLTNEDLVCVSNILTLKNLCLSGNGWLTGKGLLLLKSSPNLEHLELAACSELDDADLEQLSPCETLISLDVSECERITGKFLMHFAQLITLNLKYCTGFMGDFLACLSNLKSLNLTKCPITDEHILHLKYSKKLINLNLTGCVDITDRGMEVLAYLRHLRELILTWCDQISNVTLKKIGSLVNLNTLYLTCCNKITNSGLLSLLPLRNLCRLDLAHCTKLSDSGISMLLDMPRLLFLNLTNCSKVQSDKLPRFDTTVHSRRKELHPPAVILEEDSTSDDVLENVPAPNTSKSLPSVCIKESPFLDFSHQSIDDDTLIEILKTHKGAIHSINLRGCLNITEKSISAIATMCPELKSLDLSHCRRLENASLLPLSSLPRLETLFLNNCDWLTSLGLQYLQGSKRLKTLHLGSCFGLTNGDLALLSGFKSLYALHLSGSEWLNKEGIEHIAQLTELNALYLNNCSQLQDADLTPLAHLLNLSVLDLSWCESIQGTFLSSLMNVETLILDFCSALNGDNLRLQRVNSLSLVNCPISDEDLEILSIHGQQLRFLNLTNCDCITDRGLGFVAILENLTSLNISFCDAISNTGIDHLSNHSQLTELSVAGCTKMDDVSLQSIQHLSNLTFLDLSGCPNFTSEGLLALEPLTELILLKLNGCEQVQVSDLDTFHSAHSDDGQLLEQQLEKDLPFDEVEEDVQKIIAKYLTTSTDVQGLTEDPIYTGEI